MTGPLEKAARQELLDALALLTALQPLFDLGPESDPARAALTSAWEAARDRAGHAARAYTAVVAP